MYSRCPITLLAKLKYYYKKQHYEVVSCFKIYFKQLLLHDIEDKSKQIQSFIETL